MPELDADVYQWVALGLLGIILVVLILALATLRRIRKAIERTVAVPESSQQHQLGESPATSHQAGDVEATAQRPVLSAESPSAGEPLGASNERGEPQPAPLTTAPSQAAGASEGGLDTGAYLRAQSARNQTVAQESVAADSAAPSAAETREQAPVTRAEEPEEQPFERDGRWWFRRDEELLVYDERTGQWGPAPQEDVDSTVLSPALGSERSAEQSTSPVAREGSDVTSVLPVQSVQPSTQEPAGESFWKCSSCGAVNAASGTSCRMCFTPRGLG